MSTILRLAAPDDAPSILDIYGPLVRDSPVSFELQPPTEEQMRERVTHILESKPWIVCEVDGQVAGYAYATAFRSRPAYRWSAEVSAYVADAHRRCGVGTGLYRSLLEILRLQGYVSAYAGITLPNPASVRLHEQVGFREVGVFRAAGHKFGQWHDVGWWQRLLGSDPPSAPAPPRGLDELRADGSLGQALRLEGG
jgi:phosphinothricin acetyltransferase